MWCAGVTILKPLEKPIKPASFFDALVPITVLICLLGAAVYLFGDNKLEEGVAES
jgi:NhaC family Na+:H+ antiporter